MERVVRVVEIYSTHDDSYLRVDANVITILAVNCGIEN